MLGGRGGDIFGYVNHSGIRHENPSAAELMCNYRHRPMLLFGMSFFSLFTLVSALTPTFIGLVIARAFQGEQAPKS